MRFPYARWWLLVVLAACVTGCGFQTQEEPAAGVRELRFLSETSIKTLDPQLTSWLVDFRVIEGLFEPLLRVNPATLELEPSAAAALPTVSGDGLTYTFTIREDARWSNGDPLRAADFIYGWKRALLPDLAADYSALLFCIEGAEAFFSWRAQRLASFRDGGLTAEQLWRQTHEHFARTVGLEAPDQRTLRVTLRQPTAYFDELTAFASYSPVHQATADAYLELSPDTGAVTMDSDYFRSPDKLITNGPYRLTEWTRQRLILEANPHWWDRQHMGNDRVVTEVVADPINALIRYDRGEVDWYPNLPTALRQAADLVRSGRDDVHYGPAAATYYYAFNCKPEIDGRPNPLADARVRRALSLAVDRRNLVENITRLNQPVARTFVPPGAIPGYEAPVEAGVRFDPEAARQLLAEAGHADGSGISGLTLLYNAEGGHELPAEAIANGWRQHLGVTVQLESIDRTAFSDRLKNGGFTIARASWFGDYRDPTTFLDKFRANNGNNDGAYNNPAYDALMDRAETLLDPAERLAVLREAEALLISELPLIPLYHYTNLELFDPARVKNLHPNIWNYRRLEAVAVEATGNRE